MRKAFVLLAVVATLALGSCKSTCTEYAAAVESVATRLEPFTVRGVDAALAAGEIDAEQASILKAQAADLIRAAQATQGVAGR